MCLRRIRYGTITASLKYFAKGCLTNCELHEIVQVLEAEVDKAHRRANVSTAPAVSGQRSA